MKQKLTEPKRDKNGNIVKEDYWFKRKRFGYGWYPSSWQGWTVTIGAIVLIFLSSTLFAEESASNLTAFFLSVILIVIILIRVAYTHGEKPMWQWNGEPIHKQPEEKKRKKKK